MPNLNPPITTLEQAIEYRKRIMQLIPQGISFTPLMTAYLTDDASVEVLEQGFDRGIFHAVKLYPVNVTTNSSYGVSDLKNIDSVLEMMERVGMPLLIHGEVNDPSVDIYDREAVFIDRHLSPLLTRFPGIKIVLEHITTDYAVSFVESSQQYKLASTITPHHLHINRNAMFLGGLRSDFYCLPVAKREKHRIALRKAATSGKKCFFLGTDSAPHPRDSKEASCACAGIFNAPFALESYAEVFYEENALDKLEAFASENGALFYGLPLNNEKITLIRKNVVVPYSIDICSDLGNNEKPLVPFHAGETLRWSVLD